MRSHPYIPPPPLPPILDELSSILPFPGNVHRSRDDVDIPLCDMDPDTSQLLPARRRRHHVRVQGRLALVRSVSTADLTSSTTPPPFARGSPTTSRIEMAVAGRTVRGRGRIRRSLDGDRQSISDEEDGDERETVARDGQLRGYGIGGVGNIRRPTDVYGSTAPSRSFSRLSTVYTGDRASGTSTWTTLDKRRWNLRDILGLAPKKGKQRAPAARRLPIEQRKADFGVVTGKAL